MNYLDFIPKSPDGIAAVKWWEKLEAEGKAEIAWAVERLILAIDSMHRAIRRGDRNDYAQMHADEVVARFEYLTKTHGLEAVLKWTQWLKGQLGFPGYIQADGAYRTAKGLIATRIAHEKAKREMKK